MIYLVILLILISLASLVLVAALYRRFTEHLRVQENRLLRMERLASDLYQEKTIGMVRQMQGRMRVEHEAHRAAMDEPGEAWAEIEAMFQDEDRNFSTALRILLEARRMYEERMKRLDRLA